MCRCSLCPFNVSYSLQATLRRLNEHRKTHGAAPLTSIEFAGLERVEATQTGLKHSWVQVKPLVQIPDDFRSESLLESRLALLKSSLFFDGELEGDSHADVSKFFQKTSSLSENPFLVSVLSLFERTDKLCRTAGSSTCRQHAMRNCEGVVTAKCFETVTPKTQKVYAKSVADYVYYLSKTTRASKLRADAEDYLSEALFEKNVSITQTFTTRKFLQASYVSNGCGEQSRNAQFVVHQCVRILYAFRCIYMCHCLAKISPSMVHEPEWLSLTYLNSQRFSAFTALQNIKRPAKQCIPDHHRQNITWMNQEHTVLNVHVGYQGLERVTVSHVLIKEVYDKIFSDICRVLKATGVPILEHSDFKKLKDSSSSTRSGEGLGTFNTIWRYADFCAKHSSTDFRIKFLENAQMLYRLSMAAIHLCGGPAPRGTEEAVTRLTNSQTEAMRNVQLTYGTIGIIKG